MVKRYGLKISQHTFALLECMNTLNKHSEQVYKVLADYFDDSAANSLMEKRYYPAFEEIKKRLKNFLLSQLRAILKRLILKKYN